MIFINNYFNAVYAKRRVAVTIHTFRQQQVLLLGYGDIWFNDFSLYAYNAYNY